MREQALTDGKYLGEKSKLYKLFADNHEQAGDSESACVKRDASDLERSHSQSRPANQAQYRQPQTRHHRQPARGIDAHETEVPPPTPPRLQMRWPRPPVRMQRDGHFGDAQRF